MYTNILVTGGCGFIGSNYLNLMVKKYPECNFINLDFLYYCASLKNIKVENKDNYKFIQGDICDKDLISNILKDNNIDCIMHFAAQSHVQNSFDNVDLYVKDNILGTKNLLECSRNYGKLKLFLHVSTDEVYGESYSEDNEDNIKTEKSLLDPTTPYSSSKAAAELLAMSYYHSFKLPIMIVRSNNVYGFNQYPEKVIPRFIMLLSKDMKLTIQGKGDNLRTFVHSYDSANAFDLISRKGEIGEIYNIGSDMDSERSVIDLAKLLIKKLKNTEDYDKYIEYVPDRIFNDTRYYICDKKLRKLGWTQNISFEEGLDMTINWYLNEIDLETHWDELRMHL